MVIKRSDESDASYYIRMIRSCRRIIARNRNRISHYEELLEELRL